MSRLRKRVVIVLVLICMLMIGIQGFAFLRVKATYTGGNIYIKEDGSIDPTDAPIDRNGDLFTLTDDISVGSGGDGIFIERDNVTLEGSGHTISGGGSGIGISLYYEITEPEWAQFPVKNVTIRNTRVQGFAEGIVINWGYGETISGNRISGCGRGLVVTCGHDHYGEAYSSDSLEVTENDISASNCGVEFANSVNSTVSGNNITANGNGDAVALSWGYSVEWTCIVCSNNSITGNNITAENGDAVKLTGAVNNTLDTNNIGVSNGNGITLTYVDVGIPPPPGWAYNSSANIVTNNNFEIDNGYSVQLLNSSDNVFYHNNFFNSGAQVYLEYSTNTKWDNGYPSGGNYWSDFEEMGDFNNGPDQNLPGADGICDWPYVIGEIDQDNYPLMQPRVLVGITINNVVEGVPPSEPWDYIITHGEAIFADFTLPAGGGSISFPSVGEAGGDYLIVETTKFGYTTSMTINGGAIIDNSQANVHISPGDVVSVNFINSAMPAFATQYLGQAPPSDLNIQLPALKPIPVQSSWTVDISGNTIPDLVLGKPMAVLVSLAGVVLQSTDQVTVSVTFEGTQYSKSFSAVDLGISAIVGFSPIVPGKTATEDITGNYQVNSVNPIALTPTRVTVKTTNSLSLYFAYLSGSYGSVNQAAFDLMAQNSVAFLNATYPIKNVTADIVYSGKSITGSSKTGTSAMQADCVAVAAKAKSVMGAGAIGVAIGPNNTGLNNYFAALGKSGAAGVSFGPSTKGVVVLDGYYTAVAHEVAHTYGLYWGKPEQYQTNPPNGKASSGVWPTKSQWRTGYSFMGTAPYKTLDFSWVDDANTYRYLFNHTATNVADPEIVVVSGLIYKTGEVEFVSPWYHFNQGTADTVPTGNYALKFLDANGGTLKITSFEADFFMHIDPGTGVGENQVDTSAYGMVPLDAASFVFAAEYPTGTAKIQVIDVTKPQTPLATVSAGNLVQVTHASGNSNIDLSGSNNMIIITGGNHFIDCRHATSTTILKIGKGNNIIILGGGNNVVKETAGGSDAITACDGSSDIDIAADGNYLIATSSGNDKIQITGNGGSIILAGNGDNVITISGDGNNAIATGSGKDLITVGNGNNIIFAGAGNDIITVGKGNNYVDGGAGYDVCVHGNGRNTIVNCEKK